MKRRDFLNFIAKAGAVFTILPPATTYERIWKVSKNIINPDWIDAPFEVHFLINEHNFINTSKIVPSIINFEKGLRVYRFVKGKSFIETNVIG